MSAGYYAKLRARVPEADRQAIAAGVQAELARYPADDGASMLRVPHDRGSALWLRVKVSRDANYFIVMVSRRKEDLWRSLRVSDLQLARALVWPDDAVVEAHLRPEKDDPQDLTVSLWGPLPVGGAR